MSSRLACTIGQAQWYTPCAKVRGLMEKEEHSHRRLRFGVFEMDFRRGELRKHGMQVRLQKQPFQVLAMLLEHAGEVVTREELQKNLWPADTFVDFDHGLNKTINKIRDTLGDSAESPRFLETLARRGYRFIGDVSVVDEDLPDKQEIATGTPPRVKDHDYVDIAGKTALDERRPQPMTWKIF